MDQLCVSQAEDNVCYCDPRLFVWLFHSEVGLVATGEPIMGEYMSLEAYASLLLRTEQKRYHTCLTLTETVF